MENNKVVIRKALAKNIFNSKKIFEAVQDYDLSSLYPSIISAFNICAETSLGKISYYDENEEDKTEEFMDHYIGKDALSFCNQYFNLPSVTDMIDRIDRKYYPEDDE